MKGSVTDWRALSPRERATVMTTLMLYEQACRAVAKSGDDETAFEASRAARVHKIARRLLLDAARFPSACRADDDGEGRA